jgi:hypothetical protein
MRGEFLIGDIVEMIVADANKQRSIAGCEWNRERDRQTASRAVKKYLATHPAIKFHLKGDPDRISKDEAVFEGIADVGLVLQQQEQMP